MIFPVMQKTVPFQYSFGHIEMSLGDGQELGQVNEQLLIVFHPTW